MESKLLRRIAWTAVVAGGTVIVPLLAVPHLAVAQMPTGARPIGGRPAPAPPKVAPPPALPGAANREGTPAPAEKTPSDMAPNDALFDAINRGDVAAARDALSRGADLNAQNVLGLTPLDLAVDLGRNDIAFLLLSMRAPGGSPAGAAPGAPLPVAGTPPAKSPARRPVTAARRPAPVVPPAPPERPRLFAHDGGTPIPSVGFLGFGPQNGAP